MIEAAQAHTAQYEVMYDLQRSIALQSLRGTVGYEQKFAWEKARLVQQMKTDIGERLGVAESTIVYEVRNGIVYEPGSDEPFLESMKRGIGKNPIDLPREKAELFGFETVIQGYLANPETPDGRSVLETTPKGLLGSNYEKNYFDIHTKVDGKIVMTRYRSNLTNDEYREKIIQLDPNYDALLPQHPTDIDFKLNPVIIPSYLDYSNPSKLARFMLKEEVGMPKEKFDDIFLLMTPVVVGYANTVADNPEALEEAEMHYIANLNVAFEASQQEHPTDLYSLPSMQRAMARASQHSHDKEGQEVVENINKFGLPKMEIVYLAQDPVRIGAGGCGSVNGACSIGGETLINLGIQITDEYGKLQFNCPDCKEQNTRGLHQLITKCQNKKCESTRVLPSSLATKTDNSVSIL